VFYEFFKVESLQNNKVGLNNREKKSKKRKRCDAKESNTSELEFSDMSSAL